MNVLTEEMLAIAEAACRMARERGQEVFNGYDKEADFPGFARWEVRQRREALWLI